MPSGESTPSARGFERRWWRSCSLTMGGPSRRRFTEYQKPSSSSALPPRRPTALRMATSASRHRTSLSWRSYHRQAASSLRGQAGCMTRAPAGAQISGWPTQRRRLGQLRGAGSGEKLVGGVDHDVAALPRPDPAPELDLAPGLDARYVRAPVEERGDLPGAVGDLAREHAAVLH